MHKLSIALLLFFTLPAQAAELTPMLGQTGSMIGIVCLAMFVISYGFVMTEEFTGLRKSKPVIMASGFIWILAAYLAIQNGYDREAIRGRLMHDLMNYAELLLFLLVSMTYTNAMTERNVFEVLRSWLSNKHFSYRQLFWITGIIAFFLSSFANNMTTALLVGAVVMAFADKDAKNFVNLSFINIVVAANAGGAFSPFGDITTLMVWQSGRVPFIEFFQLFIPALLNFAVPALCMQFFVPNTLPPVAKQKEKVRLKTGAKRIMAFFILTIVFAILGEQYLFIPPFMGMMVGLSFLMMLSYHFSISNAFEGHYDIFNCVRDSEWDTLLFFFGVVFAVGGLQFIGYLDLMSHTLYVDMGPTQANIILGILSSVIDNIPVMFSVLSMHPEMNTAQWQLITLTTGVGGSLLSVGSAAGVALMGQGKGFYTFVGHLKWMPVILLGYIISIYAHLMLNG
ncbi:MAG: sodium:proton antiporter NhaD [Methylobacter sp.]|uniref:sodium:proton antiporter NhaD n=1 Tax=Methylobacter sp. TaxID=2051955 RepID=UPI0025F771F5|nr:sodium:proton antiporter NhaD [Methylobacter sp.]MCK9621776.1 sodium:proton antiporter NhaD [Methylobacter sp.]